MRPPAPTPPVFADLPRPLLFAHRGASRQAPENTFDAFDLALRLGADVLEMDVHLSADGEVMVFHDATLERTTNGTGMVCQKTAAELQDLDAGCRFVTPGGARPFVDRQVRIPRLIDIVRAFPQCGYNIEIKHSDPRLLEQVLRIVQLLPPTRVVLAAEHDSIMEQIEARRSPCGLSMSRGQVLQAVRQAVFARPPLQYGGRAMQIPARHHGIPLAQRRLVRTMHRAGIEVHLWVINEPQTAARYLQRGVDGIMTDDPARLLPALQPFRRAGSPQAGIAAPSPVL